MLNNKLKSHILNGWAPLDIYAAKSDGQLVEVVKDRI